MKRFALIGVLTALILCSACGRQTERREMTRVVFARGHGSTWGNQFRMDVCSTEVSYTHFFEKNEQGRQFRELLAVPIEEAVWNEIEAAAAALLPQLEIQKPPGLLKRLMQAMGPKTVDGGEWAYLTVTWLVDGEFEDVQYIWTDIPEAESFALALEELALSLKQ